MRNKGIWGKGLSVGECETARTYTYTIHIHLLYHTYKTQNTHISTTNLLYKYYAKLSCKTYTFVVFYTYLQVVPGCFSLFRFSLNNGYFYSMTYSFPISLHKFSYFLSNLLIFNCLCIKLF